MATRAAIGLLRCVRQLLTTCAEARRGTRSGSWGPVEAVSREQALREGPVLPYSVRFLLPPALAGTSFKPPPFAFSRIAYGIPL